MVALPMVCPLTWIIGSCAEIMMTSVCKQCCSGQEMYVMGVLLALQVDCVLMTLDARRLFGAL